MLRLLGLSLFLGMGAVTALAVEAALPGGEQLGEVEFALGPATAQARFYLEKDGEPRVDVVVRNRSDEPIWFRGGGIGCISSGWAVAPLTTDGKSMPELGFTGVGCTMEKDHPPTAEELAEWRMAPGAERRLQYHPMSRWDEHGSAGLTFDRWARTVEMTLPVDAAPEGSMHFRQLRMVLAWSEATGPQVLTRLDGDPEVTQFDPFAERPFWKGEVEVPVRIGPLRGFATLDDSGARPRIALTVRNPLDRAVRWSPRRAPEGATAPRVLVLQPGAEDTVLLGPFADAELGSEELRLPQGEPDGREHWTAFEPSSWPALVEDEATPLLPVPAHLLIHWDSFYGLDLQLRAPGVGRGFGLLRPYSDQPTVWAAAPSFRLGSLQAVASAWFWIREYELQVFNTGVDPVYWNEDLGPTWGADGTAVELPGGGALHLWERPPHAEPDEDDDDAEWVDSLRIPPGGNEGSYGGLLGEPEEEEGPRVDAWLTAYDADWRALPWTVRVPGPLPRASRPAHAKDFEQGVVRLRWRPDAGLLALPEAP